MPSLELMAGSQGSCPTYFITLSDANGCLMNWFPIIDTKINYYMHNIFIFVIPI
jgi:hypothetical protein